MGSIVDIYGNQGRSLTRKTSTDGLPARLHSNVNASSQVETAKDENEGHEEEHADGEGEEKEEEEEAEGKELEKPTAAAMAEEGVPPKSRDVANKASEATEQEKQEQETMPLPPYEHASETTKRWLLVRFDGNTARGVVSALSQVSG